MSRLLIKDMVEFAGLVLVASVVAGIFQGLSVEGWIVLVPGSVAVGVIIGVAWHMGRRHRP